MLKHLNSEPTTLILIQYALSSTLSISTPHFFPLDNLTGFLNLSQLQVMGAVPPKLHSSSTFSPALILRSPGN